MVAAICFWEIRQIHDTRSFANNGLATRLDPICQRKVWVQLDASCGRNWKFADTSRKVIDFENYSD
jgi:hypothetical protein